MSDTATAFVTTFHHTLENHFMTRSVPCLVFRLYLETLLTFSAKVVEAVIKADVSFKSHASTFGFFFFNIQISI